ncbi:MAG: type II toxin-antitoxin system HigB family toxin [Desulfobacterales bacterium]
MVSVEELQDNPGTPGTNVPYLIIGGGKYRLIVRINFIACRMWVKYILPHDKYEKLNLKEDSKCRP